MRRAKTGHADQDNFILAIIPTGKQPVIVFAPPNRSRLKRKPAPWPDEDADRK
jgi:hypothetical protein